MTHPRSHQESEFDPQVLAMVRLPFVFVLRALLFGFWITLVTVTPIATTCLMAVTLLGSAVVLFFGGLLQLPQFHAAPILAVSATSLALAALLNGAIVLLRPH